MQLDGRAVLVAGGSGGIGSAVVAAVREAGGSAYAVDRETIDVTEPGGAERAVDAARSELGRLDGIVHAIGMSGRRLGDGPITSCTDEAWTEVHRVNHESVFRLLRAGLPALDAPGGSFVAVGSALAATLDDDFLTVAYASAKGALVPLIRSAAYAVAAQELRVNLVSPGLVETPMAGRALADPGIRARLPELHPLGARASTPAEVAATVCWLLSAESARITGATIPADGGWTLR